MSLPLGDRSRRAATPILRSRRTAPPGLRGRRGCRRRAPAARRTGARSSARTSWVRSFPLLEDDIEPVEPMLPLPAEALDPPGHVLHLLGTEPALPRAALLLGGHEVRLLEDADMLHHPRQRDA